MTAPRGESRTIVTQFAPDSQSTTDLAPNQRSPVLPNGANRDNLTRRWR